MIKNLICLIGVFFFSWSQC